MGLALRGEGRGDAASGRASAHERAAGCPRLESVTDAVGLAALRPEWDELFDACPPPQRLRGPRLVATWWDAFGAEGARLAVMAFRDEDGALVGVVPLFEDRAGGPLSVRRLRLVGYAWRHGVFDMTEEPSLLVRPGWEDRVLRAVAAEVRAGLKGGRWDAASLRTYGLPLRPHLGGLSDVALTKFDARGGSDYAELPETWAAFRKAMTRSMRDNLPYYPRLLTRDGHDWSVRLLREPGEMAGAAARLADLHRARAESDRAGATTPTSTAPVQEAFLGSLLGRLAEEGNATVAELVVGGRVVASQAFVEAAGTLTVYYSGYDDAYYKYSPVFVLDSVVFKEALERGVRRLDFLRGPAPWKTRWLAAPGPEMHRAVLVSLRPASLLRYALFWAGEAYGRNVSGRAPILAREAACRARSWQARLQRASLPLLPLAGRLGLRLAPTLHLPVFHHR